MGKAAPLFTVVIPTWNRRNSVLRCLDSVLSQDWDAYEVIIVDDDSSDGTVSALEKYTDDRLKILRHSVNRGVCAARHTGTLASSGRWIISIDSDVEVLPHGLSLMAGRMLSASKDVGSLIFMAYYEKLGLLPDGILEAGRVENLTIPSLSPDNVPVFGKPFGLETYMKWAQKSVCSAAFICHRREVFDLVQWPTDRRLEFQFHLRFYEHWEGMFQQEVVGIYHEDAPFAISSDRSEMGVRREMAFAADRARAHQEILEEFGARMQEWAPHLYFDVLWEASYLHFQSGQRSRGLRYAVLALLNNPSAWQVYPLVVAGMAGPGVIRALRTLKDVRVLAQKSISRGVTRKIGP